MKIALLTSQNEYQVNQDDLLILSKLNDTVGVEACHCIWNDDNIKWEGYSKIVLRTPWDYSQNFEKFNEFINSQPVSSKLVNSLSTVKWN